MNANAQRAIVLSLLALLMLATRSHVFSHFTPVPDASWAVFFIGGFYLRGWGRWAFPLLMVLAVGIDWAVIMFITFALLVRRASAAAMMFGEGIRP